MFASASKVSHNKVLGCPRRVSKPAIHAIVATARKSNREDTVGKQPCLSAPMAFVSAAVLLSCGTANAATIAMVPPGQGWGIEALQRAWGGSVDNAARQVKNLPVNVPDTGKLQQGASAVKNAVDDATGAAKSTFQTGGGAKSVQDVVQDAASQVQAATRSAPEIFSTGSDKTAQTVEDVKGALQGGGEKINRLISSNSGSDIRRMGSEKVKEAQQGVQEVFQSSTANSNLEPLSTGVDKTKQAAEQAKNSIYSGAEQVQKAISRGNPMETNDINFPKAPEAAQSVRESAQQLTRGVQEAFQTGAVDFTTGPQQYDKQTTIPDPTQQETFQEKIGKLVGGGVKDEFKSGNENLTQANADQLQMKGGVPLDQQKLNTSAAVQTGSYNAVDNARARAAAGEDTS